MYSHNGLVAATQDMRDGIRLTPLWLKLAWEQTQQRYRRTLLGPLWLVANNLALGASLALVFGGLLGGSFIETFPRIFSGITSWTLIAGIIGEGHAAFLVGAGVMQSQRMPLTFYVFMVVQRAFINYVHQLPAWFVMIAALGIFVAPSWTLVPAVLLVTVTCFFMTLPLAMLATRFRDVGHMVGVLMQLLFILTPIFWDRAQLPEDRRWVVEYNPFAHMLELIRQPLLGTAAPLSDWTATVFVLFCAMGVSLVSLALYRRRVIFWL